MTHLHEVDSVSLHPSSADGFSISSYPCWLLYRERFSIPFYFFRIRSLSRYMYIPLSIKVKSYICMVIIIRMYRDSSREVPVFVLVVRAIAHFLTVSILMPKRCLELLEHNHPLVTMLKAAFSAHAQPFLVWTGRRENENGCRVFMSWGCADNAPTGSEEKGTVVCSGSWATRCGSSMCCERSGELYTYHDCGLIIQVILCYLSLGQFS